MANFQLMRELSVQTPSKIVMYIIDGLGGLPGPEGASELECANLPNLDRLAAESTCGLIQHVAPGITPGSGPGHLSLFGYDPLEYDIGRGILEALGLDMEVRGGDMCARGNFCTVDSDGILIGRRGGSNPVERLATETNVSLARLLSDVSIPGLTFEIKSGQEHRFAVVFRAANLEDDLTDTDPQHEGVPPRSVDAKSSKAGKTAEMVNRFIALARERLKDRDRANMIMLRGFSKQPPLPQFGDIYKLKAAAIASYPMYRGLSKLLGMEVATTGSNLAAQAQTLAERYSEYDFFFFHFKKADAAGEDGNFEAKVAALEEADSVVPQLMALDPDVLIVTGDHSTPATLAAHSWHPVPFMMKSKHGRSDDVREFSERTCRDGELGRFPATDVMQLAMANALKLAKYGA